ncbi:hypothetical protein PVL29_022239 [Vitis rotundifolia]|uniref:cysteine dioxygenase n=1 Tax=Vitis rotundifolia TaxID=103349 RepID=A0AA39DAN2_VITRO|nr:hypothetical protein PVL29_022239 [Vitis rotundifolia]
MSQIESTNAIFSQEKKESPFSVKMAKKSSSIQALFDLCKKTFSPSGAPPPSQAIPKLSSLLDTIGPADVGLREDNPEDDRGHGIFGLNGFNRIARWAQPITYLDIFECDSFTMCIFCFPTSSVIPLHDHPGMTVLSKVLYGSLHVKAYDWVEPARIQKGKGPGYFTEWGNLHCFTAITPCAVLDILAPPYQEASGRKCTYYHDYPYSSFSTGNEAEISGKEEDYAWLAEIETPDDLYMRQGVYTGPAIQV